MASNQQPQDIINQIIATDPEIQKIVQGVWGNTTIHDRPSDTPKHLEKANDRASKQIKAVLASRGISLPSRTFINPRTNSVEGMRGWAGLPPAVKVALIGAAAATGIGAASALGAFGGAAGGAGAASGAAGASTIPTVGVTSGLSAGAFPAIAGTGSLSGIAGGAGAAAAGGGGLLASTPMLSAAPQVGSAAATGGNLATAGAGNMGIGSKIGGFLKGQLKQKAGDMVSNLMDPDVLKMGSRGVADATQASAHNRGVALNAMMDADVNRMQLARDRAADESDIWKKLQAADYMKSGGMPKTGPGMSANGKPFTSFDFGPAPISAGNKEMAAKLESQLMNRLDNPMKLSDYESKMNPGTMERIGNWAAPGMSILSEVMQNRRGNPAGGQATPTPTAAPLPNIPSVPTVNGLPGGRLPGTLAYGQPRPPIPTNDDSDWSNR